MLPLHAVLAPALLAFAVAVRAAPAQGSPPCELTPAFDRGLTPLREIHVATHGSNSSGDGSVLRPFATIAFAAGLARAGDAVRVHAGEYAGGGFVQGARGTATGPIWIGGAAGEPRPIIRGGSEGLHFVRPRYLVLHDLEVVGASANGINCDDGGDRSDPDAARFLVFRNLAVHDIGGTGNQDGLKLSGVNDFVVHDSTFARCGGGASGSGIDLVGCHRGVVARCSFESMSGNAVQIKGGSEDVEVRRCRMTNAGERAVNAGGSTGFEFFRPPLSPAAPNAEARRVRIIANVIEGSNAPIAFVGCVDSLAAHNTIVTPRRWLVRILQETASGGGYTFLPCGDNRFESNLVYFSRGAISTHVNIGPNTAPHTFAFASNLWYAYDNPGASGPALPTTEARGVVGRDPMLRNPAEGDYRIGRDSPASAAGRAPAPGFAAFDGACYGDPPSIGAHEVETCAADCDRSTGAGVLDAFDYLCVQNRYAMGHPYACGLDESSGPGVCDIFDFLAFQNAYAAGCD